MEFHIDQAVRFLAGAQVSAAASAVGGGKVAGYDEVDDVDYVIVTVKGDKKSFEQWVLPEEIEGVLQ